MKWIETIHRYFEENRVLYTGHARREMRQEAFGPIADSEVFEAACGGEIIEEYPDDTPYPSALIFGRTGTSRPLHVVCAHNSSEDGIIVITVYEPDPRLWEDFRRRKE